MCFRSFLLGRRFDPGDLHRIVAESRNRFALDHGITSAALYIGFLSGFRTGRFFGGAFHFDCIVVAEGINIRVHIAVFAARAGVCCKSLFGAGWFRYNSVIFVFESWYYLTVFLNATLLTVNGLASIDPAFRLNIY